MMMRILLVAVTVLISKTSSSEDGAFTVPNKVRFPFSPVQGPFIGLFVAIFVPLDLPHANTFMSYNFEANYNLPQNETEYTYPPDVSRSFSRHQTYDMFVHKLESHGYPGKSCLLRMICEAAQYPLQYHGVLEDIVHIILTPSTSLREKNLKIYENAEAYGRNNGHCDVFNKMCSVSLLDLFTWVTSSFNGK